MLLIYGDYDYFLILNKQMNLELFLKKSKLQAGSFAAGLIERIYINLTADVVDVNDEYIKYYAKEFLTLKEFLYKKYNLSEQLLSTLLKVYNHDNYLYYGHLTDLGDYSLAYLINYSDNLRKTINNILREGKK